MVQRDTEPFRQTAKTVVTKGEEKRKIYSIESASTNNHAKSIAENNAGILSKGGRNGPGRCQRCNEGLT